MLLDESLLYGGSKSPPQLEEGTQEAAHITRHARSIENSIYVFPEMKLCILVTNSYFHVSVSDLYIPRIRLLIWLQRNRQTNLRNI
jgi:hypothetical protein